MAQREVVPRILRRKKTYAIGAYDDLHVVCAYRGSESDPLHVTDSMETILEATRRLGRKVPVMLVICAGEAGPPPSQAVRDAWVTWSRRYKDQAARIAVVILGRGAALALHRTVVRALLLLLAQGTPTSVCASLSEALRFLTIPADDLDGAYRFCEDLVRAGDPTVLAS